MIGTLDITTAKSELQGLIHGTTLNKVTNVYGAFNRAARQLLLDLDPQETKRKLQTTVFDDVFSYVSPSDLKGNKVLDIRPQVNRQLTDIFRQRYGQEFDVWKEFTIQPMFTVQFESGTKTLRVGVHRAELSIRIVAATSPTENGTWTNGGTAGTLSTDSFISATGASSIKFNLAAGANPSTGYIENTTISSTDLSNHDNQSSLFWWVYLPSATHFTSFGLRWGSSSSAYWTNTTTTQADGSALVDGWNLIKFDWSGSTTVGSPVDTAVTYSRLSFTYDGTVENGVHVEQFISKLPIQVDIWYYSKFLFRDATTGTFQETVTSDSNVINLDTDTYNVYLWQVALQIMQQVDIRSEDIPYFENQYVAALTKYKAMYKTEVQKPTVQYYKQPNPRWSRFLGKRY